MILDCKPIAERIKQKLLLNHSNSKLAILYYGLDSGQLSYIKSIQRIANQLNIKTELFDLKFDTPYKLTQNLSIMNDINSYKGILPIRPFPKEIDTYIRENINPSKDIDNFSGKSDYISCTAEGVLEILEYYREEYDINYLTKRIIIIGRNEGKQIFDLLLKNNATCTLAHSKTNNLSDYILTNDIIITCTGKKNLITNNMVNDNTLIIDVGRNEVSKELYQREKVLVTPSVNGTGLITTYKLMEHIMKVR